MSDRPIILTPWQIQAVQEGRLKQIRVPVTVPWKGRKRVPPYEPYYVEEDGRLLYQDAYGDYRPMEEICPFQPGDVLYVREVWTVYQTVNYIRRPDGGSFSEVSDGHFAYKADGFDTIDDLRDHIRLMSDCSLEAVEIKDDRWYSPATMPRAAARYWLPVGEVRVQRLGDATEKDELAEGASLPDWGGLYKGYWNARYARKNYPWAEGLWTFVATVKVEEDNRHDD